MTQARFETLSDDQWEEALVWLCFNTQVENDELDDLEAEGADWGRVRELLSDSEWTLLVRDLTE